MNSTIWTPTQAGLMNLAGQSLPELGATDARVLWFLLTQLDNNRLARGETKLFCTNKRTAAHCGLHESSIRAIKSRLAETGLIGRSNSGWVDFRPLIDQAGALRARAIAIKTAAKGAPRAPATAFRSDLEHASANASPPRWPAQHIQTSSFGAKTDTSTANDYGSAARDASQTQQHHEASFSKTEKRHERTDCSWERAGGFSELELAASSLAETPESDILATLQASQRLGEYVRDLTPETLTSEVLAARCARATAEKLTSDTSRNVHLFWVYAVNQLGVWMAARLLGFVLDDPAVTGVREPAKCFSWYAKPERSKKDLQMLYTYQSIAANRRKISAPKPQQPALDLPAPPTKELIAIRKTLEHMCSRHSTRGVWENWFERVEFVGLERGRMTIAVESSFKRDEIIKRELFLLAAGERHGVKAVDYIVRPRG